MEITEELLITIYKKANQFAIAKWREEPYPIRIEKDGTIGAVYDRSCCGDHDYDLEIITAKDLTANLDEVAAERERQLEIQRKKDLEEKQRIEKERQRIDTERRRQEYLKLKKEFE